jgi:hypothetical protein
MKLQRARYTDVYKSNITNISSELTLPQTFSIINNNSNKKIVSESLLFTNNIYSNKGYEKKIVKISGTIYEEGSSVLAEEKKLAITTFFNHKQLIKIYEKNTDVFYWLGRILSFVETYDTLRLIRKLEITVELEMPFKLGATLVQRTATVGEGEKVQVNASDVEFSPEKLVFNFSGGGNMKLIIRPDWASDLDGVDTEIEVAKSSAGTVTIYPKVYSGELELVTTASEGKDLIVPASAFKTTLTGSVAGSCDIFYFERRL